MKEFAFPEKFYPFRVSVFFLRVILSREENSKSQKLIPFLKWWENVEIYLYTVQMLIIIFFYRETEQGSV